MLIAFQVMNLCPHSSCKCSSMIAALHDFCLSSLEGLMKLVKRDQTSKPRQSHFFTCKWLHCPELHQLSPCSGRTKQTAHKLTLQHCLCAVRFGTKLGFSSWQGVACGSPGVAAGNPSCCSFTDGSCKQGPPWRRAAPLALPTALSAPCPPPEAPAPQPVPCQEAC